MFSCLFGVINPSITSIICLVTLCATLMLSDNIHAPFPQPKKNNRQIFVTVYVFADVLLPVILCIYVLPV